ncbi:MFS transporter [Ktedonospora formicarum]|uniref:MFS transporter n=1 Tax=Ktedonospora formicarum TaxID=2778364 RepID=A0A8J3HW06_9CHLR|nr:MFS transporter [Ktedonospora formicarum]GHO44256.1 MFS transporter [Ktedonospora formicarum]
MISTDKTTPKSTAPSFVIHIAIAFFAVLIIGANDGAFGVILPHVRSHYTLNNSVVSLLFLFSTLGYLCAAFSNGLSVEKLGKGGALLCGATIFVIGATFVSLQLPFFLLLPSMLLLGFGIAMLDAGLNTFIAGLPKSAALLNYFHAFYGIGAWLGPLAATGLLAFDWNWNVIYMLWAALGLVTLISLGIILKRHPITRPDEDTAEEKQGNVLFLALKMKVSWIGAIFLLFYVGAEVTLGSWSYSFLTEERHGDAVLMGTVVSGYWLGLTLGRLILAQFTQMIGAKRIILLCLVGVIGGLLLIWLTPNNIIAAIGLFITGFSLGPIFPTTISVMSELVPSRLLASVIGFLASLGSMGAALFPWITGNLAQFIGLWILLPFTLVLSILMIGTWLLLQTQPRQTA